MSDGTEIANSRPTLRVLGNEGTVAQGYYRLAGTSMASPHVAGIAALLRAANPSLTPEDIRGILQYTADGVIDSPRYVSKMANATAALAAAVPMPVARFDAKQVNSFETGKIDILGYAGGINFSYYTLSYGVGNIPTEWTQVKTSSTPVIKGAEGAGILEKDFDTSILPDDSITLRLQTFDTFGRSVEDRITFIVSNLKLTNPQANDVVRHGDVLEIRADMSISTVQSYTLDYVVTEQEANEDLWNTVAIENLNNNVTGKDILIGRFDTSQLIPNEFYNLRLSLNLADGTTRSFNARMIYVSNQLKPGFPINVPFATIEGYEEALLALNLRDTQNFSVVDLDGDGKNEIITFRESTNVVDLQRSSHPVLKVFNAEGQLLWEKGNLIGEDARSNFVIVPRFVFADLNGDGFKEIVFPTYIDILGRQVFEAVKHDGSTYPGWPIRIENADSGGDNIISADLDRDGLDELIFKYYTIDAGVLILNSNGTIRTRFSLPNPCRISSLYLPQFLAVGNFDNDETLEVLYRNGCDELVVFNEDGSILPGWPRKYGPGFLDLPTAADLNGDGIDEIIFIISSSIFIDDEESGILVQPAVFVTDNKGDPLLGWPATLERSRATQSFNFSSQPSVGDLHNDGSLDIVVTCNLCTPNQILVFNLDGTLQAGWPVDIWTDPVMKRRFFGDLMFNQMLADVDNDGFLDIVLSNGGIRVESIRSGDHQVNGGILAYDRFGKVIDLNPHPDMVSLTTETAHPLNSTFLSPRMPPVILDLDGDGTLDVLASISDTLSFKSSPGQVGKKRRGTIYAWSLQTPDLPGRVAWGIPHGSVSNSGSANPPAKVPYVPPVQDPTPDVPVDEQPPAENTPPVQDPAPEAPLVKLAAPDYTLTRRHDTYYLNVKDIPPGARQLVAEVIQQRVQRRGRQIIGRETLRSASRVVTSLDGSKTSLSLVGRMKIDRAFRGGYLSFYYIDAQGNRGEVSGLRGLVGAWNHPRAARTAEVVIRQMGNLRTYEPTARRRRR